MDRIEKLQEYKQTILEEIEKAENEESKNQWKNALKSIEEQEKEFKGEKTKETCANCRYYNDCLPKFKRTILAETEKMENCSCYNWERGTNEIQTSLF